MNHTNHFPARFAARFSLLLVLALLIAACSPGLVPQTGNEASSVTVELTDSAITASSPPGPGVTTISVQNTGQTPRTVNLALLNTDVTFEQFMETLSTDDMAAVELVSLAGGRDAPSGESQFMADLKEGTYVVIAFPQGEGAPLTTSFVVSGSPTGQADPQAALTVDMVDFAFVLPEPIAAGEQTWEVTNTGAQWHELVILKPAPGFTQEQLLELFNAQEEPEGEPPFEQIGSFGPITEGERGWLPLDLEPGTYMLVCFLPDFASGESHLEKGMITTVEVGP